MATADPKKKKKKRKKKESLEHKRNRILVALGIFAVVYALDELGTLTAAFGTPGDIYASFALFLVPFLIAGYDVLQKAYNNIRRGKAFDESFLMAVATIGAFAMVLFPDTDPHMAEGAAVMLFYQVGELFQAYAVGKSRKSISAMMAVRYSFCALRRLLSIRFVASSRLAAGLGTGLHWAAWRAVAESRSGSSRTRCGALGMVGEGCGIERNQKGMT